VNVEVVALSGGVGGAKLALGLDRLYPDGRLACIVNTGDDFDHLGLRICPDIDTLLYTLAGCNDPEQGWGRANETWTFMRALQSLGGPTWFRLGDGDLATHLERTRRLHAGSSLTEATAQLAKALGIGTLVLPMSDQPVATRVQTTEGDLDFQDYFVARRAEPRVTGVEFSGHERARLTDAVRTVLASPRLQAIVLCPSNPWLSVDPILSVPGLRSAVRNAGVPVVAVCPLIAGKSVKGPTAKIMSELGIETNPLAIATHYAGVVDGLVLDVADSSWADRCPVPTHVAPTLMLSLEDRKRLAAQTIAFANELRGTTGAQP
jgi:LPPG:FO 2-phospho-L-lactate transferase